MTKNDQAILDFLNYKAVFKSPVTFYQLYNFVVADRPILLNEFSEALNRLMKKNLVKSREGLFYVGKISVNEYRKKHDFSLKIINKVKPDLQKLGKFLPWIKFIGITGSFAALAGEKKDDIDIFIISAQNRVWLTRFFTVLWLKTRNMYRNDTNFSLKFCPNIYIGENFLTWDKKKHSIYVAHEILSMIPCYDKDNYYFKFLVKNEWVLKYFGMFDISHLKELVEDTLIKEKSLLDFVDRFFMFVQKIYMKPRIKNDILERDLIHFLRFDWSKKFF